jgi:hypothetical protein
VAASFHFEEDIWVSFSIEETPKKPDLYLRPDAIRKSFVEVKVPMAFT